MVILFLINIQKMSDKAKFIEFIKSQEGKLYKLGSIGPDDYDCSGLIYAGLKNLTNEKIPRTSTEQYSLGKDIDIDNVQEGDLIFFDTGWTTRKPNHNGVCISNSEMINANSHYNSVIKESFIEDYWKEKIYGKVKRIFFENGKINLSGLPEQHFLDVPPSHEFFEYIENLYAKKVINGYSDGFFKPENYINRVESLKIILQALKIDISENFNNLPFSDIENNAWYAKYINTAVSKGIISGYPNGTFKPNNNINRAEICKIIFKSGNIEPPLPSNSPFTDVKLDSWYAKYVIKAYELNMFKPISANKFTPSAGVKRGEMCKAIVNFLKS